jgi:hypothetical protein
VIFGVRFESVAANLVLGPLMGLVVGAYAYGLWTLRRWAAPLSIFYAFYVPTNLVLFWYFQTGPDVPPVGGIVAYLAIAFTGSIGTALHLRTTARSSQGAEKRYVTQRARGAGPGLTLPFGRA